MFFQEEENMITAWNPVYHVYILRICCKFTVQLMQVQLIQQLISDTYFKESLSPLFWLVMQFGIYLPVQFQTQSLAVATLEMDILVYSKFSAWRL